MEIASLTALFAFLTSLDGGSQRLVVTLSHSKGAAPGILTVGAVASCASAALAAWLGAETAALSADWVRVVVVVAALMLAIAWLLIPSQQRELKEPTRSLGAIGLVIFMRQMREPAPYVVFAGAALVAAVWSAFVGGAAGIIAALGLGVFLPNRAVEFPVSRALRIVLAIALAGASLLIASNAHNSIS